MKMDDDVLLNIPELQAVLKTHEEAKYIYQDSKLLIWGQLRNSAKSLPLIKKTYHQVWQDLWICIGDM